MIILFISSLLCTIEVVLQHCNCLNLIDLQHGGAVHSHKWKLESRRAPAVYERMMTHTLPRKREIKSNFRRYLHANKKPHNKIFFKGSRRFYEDERDANLKNKLLSLTKQTMLDTEEMMYDVEIIKEKYREETPYKAGFVLAMLKKSRDVVNELFNVAIKHRDEWQALEQLKIFEIIVHTNIDTSHLLKQLLDLQNGNDVALGPILGKIGTDEVQVPDKIGTDEAQAPDKIGTDEVQAPDKIGTDEVKAPDNNDTDEVKAPERIGTDKVQAPDKIGTDEVQAPDKIGTDEVKAPDKIGTDEVQAPDKIDTDEVKAPVKLILVK